MYYIIYIILNVFLYTKYIYFKFLYCKRYKFYFPFSFIKNKECYSDIFRIKNMHVYILTVVINTRVHFITAEMSRLLGFKSFCITFECSRKYVEYWKNIFIAVHHGIYTYLYKLFYLHFHIVNRNFLLVSSIHSTMIHIIRSFRDFRN